jgi:3-oxoacyl-[acyl-carrier-protein] synthase III
LTRIAAVAAELGRRQTGAAAVRAGLVDAGALAAGGWHSVSVADGVPAVELAARAGRAALARSGQRADQVAALFYATASEPSMDLWPGQYYVQRATIGEPAPAFELRQACCGMLGAIELAAGFLAARADARAVLLAGGDNFSTVRPNRWRYLDGQLTNRVSVLGDAGSALVLSRTGGFATVLAVRSASIPQAEQMYRGEQPLHPPAGSGQVPPLGRRMTQFADRNPAAARTIKAALARARTEVARRCLDAAGVAAADIARVVHVFAGQPGYLHAILDPLGIDPGRGMLDFGRTVGHLGVNDHVVGLDHLLATGAVGPGEHVLLLGNGIGIALASAVIRIDRHPAWLTAAGAADGMRR